jgi:hypothetical protein
VSEDSSYPRPTRPDELRYLLAGLASIVVIAGYALLEPSCKFLFLKSCDTSGPNFASGLVVMVFGMILWVLVWVNSARRVWKMSPKQ